MADLNTWSDVSSIANSIQQDAYFIVREMGVMQNLITVFRDATGMNTRKSYKYNAGTAQEIGDEDDLSSSAFTPSADQTLTPKQIGLQFFVTDARAASDLPENIIRDAARELGFAALDKVEGDLIDLLPSLTGGSLGAGTATISWGRVFAGIAQAHNANKSVSVPLSYVLHGYQYQVLGKAASVAAAAVVNAPGFAEEMTRKGFVQVAGGVPMYEVFASVETSGTNFRGGIFPREAMAIDWRQPIRVEPQRDASRRGWEFNMSAIYACGVWRPDLGVCMDMLAETPTS
jgi:hypothetical protein